MDFYGKCIAYLFVGFILGVVGLAVNGGGEDDLGETASWMLVWTFLWPLMLALALVSLTLERFAGDLDDDDPADE